jgi:hypothetical protein
MVCELVAAVSEAAAPLGDLRLHGGERLADCCRYAPPAVQPGRPDMAA